MHNVFSNLSSAGYAEASVLAELVSENMISQLELVKLKPKVIVDLGCGPGNGSIALARHYPEAFVVGVDSADSMLTARQINPICADALRLPLQDHSVDLIFANLLLPWCADWEAFFRECKRVLCAEGLLVFSCFGLDTLRELSNSIVIRKDMHEIGDSLVRAKFSDPVMDVEYLTMTYREAATMKHELHMTGMIVDDDIKLEKNVEQVYALTYEIIYGHAWRPDLAADCVADEDGIVRIPLTHLRRRS